LRARFSSALRCSFQEASELPDGLEIQSSAGDFAQKVGAYYHRFDRQFQRRALAGRASVIDADTIEIHGQRIRIWGVDAPEGGQTCQDTSGNEYRCGQIGAMKLASYLNDAQPIVCAQRDTDQYGRIVATCENIYGQDLARWLVRDGHALDWPQFSKGAYADVQKDAQSLKAGIWQGSFMEPWEWRKTSKGAM
jgi:endonuclease YncB( thermonuclease family)